MPNGKGQCNACKEWNGIIAEEIIQKQESSLENGICANKQSAKTVKKLTKLIWPRKSEMDTTDSEFNRVLGVWTCSGSLIYGRNPELEKSTLLLYHQ